MSPAVNVDLEEVPFAILELVKARILANRRRLLQGQQGKPRPSTRPGAQFRKVGASSKEWRKPQYGAGVFSQPGNTGLAWLLFPKTAGGFNATWAWAETTGDFDPIIKNDDTYTFKVGSGDGSTWLTASVSLPGIAAWRSSRRTPFEPYATDYTPFGYRTDPTGKSFSGDSRAVDDSRITTFALPCGNGAAIIVVNVRAAGSFGGYTYRATDAYTLPRPDGNTYWLRVGSSTVTTVSNYNVAASDTAVFVVSQRGCRQLSIPPQLQSVINTLLPTTSWGNEYAWFDFPELRVTLQLPTATNEYWYGTGYQRRMLNDALSLPLYTRYGADSHVMQYTDPGYRFDTLDFTPAIYALLTKYADLFPTLPFEDGLDYDYNYSEGRAALRALGSPAPTHVVGFDARADDFKAINTAIWNYAPGYDTFGVLRHVYRDVNRYLSGIRVVRSNTQPPTNYDQLPAEGSWSTVATLPLAPDRPTVEGDPEDFYSLLWHYDWGNPAYCRQQLLALGFTAEDLTP